MHCTPGCRTRQTRAASHVGADPCGRHHFLQKRTTKSTTGRHDCRPHCRAKCQEGIPPFSSVVVGCPYLWGETLSKPSNQLQLLCTICFIGAFIRSNSSVHEIKRYKYSQQLPLDHFRMAGLSFSYSACSASSLPSRTPYHFESGACMHVQNVTEGSSQYSSQNQLKNLASLVLSVTTVRVS